MSFDVRDLPGLLDKFKPGTRIAIFCQSGRRGSVLYHDRAACFRIKLDDEALLGKTPLRLCFDQLFLLSPLQQLAEAAK